MKIVLIIMHLVYRAYSWRKKTSFHPYFSLLSHRFSQLTKWQYLHFHNHSWIDLSSRFIWTFAHLSHNSFFRCLRDSFYIVEYYLMFREVFFVFTLREISVFSQFINITSLSYNELDQLRILLKMFAQVAQTDFFWIFSA